MKWVKKIGQTLHFAQMYVVKGEANQPTKYNIGGGSFVVNGNVAEGR